MIQPPVTLQIPEFSQSGSPGYPWITTYLATGDGLFVGYVGGGTSPSPSWGMLSVTCTDSSGNVVITGQVSGENNGATGTVMDNEASTLVIPVQSGTTFALTYWGGKYASPNASAYFFPFGDGTAVSQNS
ncbi:MAG TPA: hypothetical protein VGH73_14565 [Thermoanaerobaculia bacterium]